MSVGAFHIRGYDIELYETTFRIHGPQEAGYALAIMGAYRDGETEPLEISIINELNAKIETEASIFRVSYIDDPNEPNGQFEINVKIPDEIPSWTTLVNGIPKEVIRVILLILNGDEEADEYRRNRNNNSVNDPGFSNEPYASNSGNSNSNTVTSPTNGGKRRRRKTRKMRR